MCPAYCPYLVGKVVHLYSLSSLRDICLGEIKSLSYYCRIVRKAFIFCYLLIVSNSLISRANSLFPSIKL
jgi:hypothetical protein